MKKISFGRKERIGHGCFRFVYAHENPEWCVKVQRKDKANHKTSDQHNYREWLIWNEYPECREWLAPVIAISEDRMELVMARGHRCKRKPKNAPKWIADNKSKNWVAINGRKICCDYGNPGTLKKIRELMDKK